MIGLLKHLTWDLVKGPLLFLSGMMVGVILVAIIWCVVHKRKAHAKRQLDEKSTESQQGESQGDVEVEDEGNYPSAIIVQGEEGDYLFEDKSQLGKIIDFKQCPRREMDRQAARRELVITMLIAESMSK